MSVLNRPGAGSQIGTTGDQRDPLLPGAPTLRKQGFDVAVASAGDLLGPAGTPAAIVHQIATATRRVMAEPAYDQAMRQFGLVPECRGPEEYAAYWARDEARMQSIMAAIPRG